jgi:hypothetical protein
MKAAIMSQRHSRNQLSLGRMRLLPLLVSMILFAVNSFAELITFTHTGTGSGTIGATSFTNAAFTITDVGDTASRSSIPWGFYIVDLSASISISGVGDFTFTSRTQTLVDNRDSGVSFERGYGYDLFQGPTDPACASWDMLSPIGPILGTGNLLAWDLDGWTVPTDGGTLFFDDGSSSSVFQATVVPEPISLSLLALGGAVMLFSRRTRRH